MKKLYFSKRIPDIGKFGASIKNNSYSILMVGMFICGLTAGALTVVSGKYSDNYFLNNILKHTVSCMVSEDKTGSFTENLISSTAFTFSTLPCALCCIGLPALCIIPALRGIGYGAVGAYLISEYSLNGMGFYCLSIVPGAVISVFALLCACTSAVSMSKAVFCAIAGKNKPDRLSVKNYIIRLAVFIGISAFGCIINLIISACSKNLFILV